MLMVAKGVKASRPRWWSGVIELLRRHDGVELAGKTPGARGLRADRQARGMIVEAIGMRVMTYDPYLDPERPPGRHVRRMDRLEDLLAPPTWSRSTYHFTEESRGMFDAMRFER